MWLQGRGQSTCHSPQREPQGTELSWWGRVALVMDSSEVNGARPFHCHDACGPPQNSVRQGPVWFPSASSLGLCSVECEGVRVSRGRWPRLCTQDPATASPRSQGPGCPHDVLVQGGTFWAQKQPGASSWGALCPGHSVLHSANKALRQHWGTGLGAAPQGI